MSSEGTPAGDSSPSSDLATEQRKRNRIRFSCTHCREKKYVAPIQSCGIPASVQSTADQKKRLKCNRQMPCDQCLKRDIASACQFIPYENRAGTGSAPSTVPRSSTATSSVSTSRAKGSPGDSALQARLRHLEHLVQVLKSQRRAPADGPLDEDNLPVEFVRYTEKAGLRAEDQRYLHADNWESIVDEVSAISATPTVILLRPDRLPMSRSQSSPATSGLMRTRVTILTMSPTACPLPRAPPSLLAAFHAPAKWNSLHCYRLDQ